MERADQEQKLFFVCCLVEKVTIDQMEEVSPSNRNMSKVRGGEERPYYQSVSAFAFSVKLDHLTLSFRCLCLCLFPCFCLCLCESKELGGGGHYIRWETIPV